MKNTEELGAYVIDFGKHVGETVADVYTADRSYLRWVVAQGSKPVYAGDGPSQHLRVLAPVVKMYLKRRKQQMCGKSRPTWTAARRDGNKAMRGRAKNGIGPVNHRSHKGTLAMEHCGGPVRADVAAPTNKNEVGK